MAPPPFSSAYHQPTSNISNTSTNGRTRQRSYASHSTPNTNDVNDTPPSAARRNRDTGVGSVSQRMSVISLSSPQPRVQYPQLPEGGKVRHTFYELPYWAQYEAVRVAVLCGFDCGGGEDALAAAALSEYFQELSVACLKMDNRVSWYQILGQFVEEHMGRGRTGGGLDVRRQSMGGSAKQRNMLTGMARVSENLWCQLQNYSWNNKVYMTGKILVDLPAQGTRREHPFTIRLNPLGSTSSNRFYRKFGSDRFLHLKLPQLSSSEYPRLEELVEFLFGGAGITLLGRTWRGIWVKEIKANRKKEKGASLQVILFATKGETIKEVIEVEDLIHWHMPLDSEKNLGLTVAKLWSRISLGFSDTNPTVCFDRDQICPSVEPRLPGEHYEPDDDLRNEINDQIGDIMDDGCSVASPAVMKRVAEILCLEEAPSAVQGRIGGAKGLWVVDPGALDEISQGLVDEDDLWIRVNKSQAKYEEHRICKDRAWKTLDVISSSKPPQPANMNLQLIPILEFRGVPFEPLRELVDEHLDMVLLELIEVQKEPVALRNWLQNRGCLSSFREYNEDLVWLGGLPAERYERLLMFVDVCILIPTIDILVDIPRANVSREEWISPREYPFHAEGLKRNYDSVLAECKREIAHSHPAVYDVVLCCRPYAYAEPR